MKDDLRYTPTDCFETFPFPPAWETNPVLEAAGKTYSEFRAALMIRNQQGLTATYNRFHDPEEADPEILRLRALHDAMDRAALDAYGFHDLAPVCTFLLDYEEAEEDDAETAGKARKKKPWRYRWPEATRDEVLARLLQLNQERAAEEAGAKAKKKQGNARDHLAKREQARTPYAVLARRADLGRDPVQPIGWSRSRAHRLPSQLSHFSRQLRIVQAPRSQRSQRERLKGPDGIGPPLPAIDRRPGDTQAFGQLGLCHHEELTQEPDLRGSQLLALTNDECGQLARDRLDDVALEHQVAAAITGENRHGAKYDRVQTHDAGSIVVLNAARDHRAILAIRTTNHDNPPKHPEQGDAPLE